MPGATESMLLRIGGERPTGDVARNRKRALNPMKAGVEIARLPRVHTCNVPRSDRAHPQSCHDAQANMQPIWINAL